MVNKSYEQAQNTGLYQKPLSLVGKYDNVRRFWEDEVTRLFLKPYLKKIRSEAAGDKRKIRIMDLGCGSGDGYELLAGTTCRDKGPESSNINILDEDEIEVYLGVDLNTGLIEQGENVFKSKDNVQFKEADFLAGLPVEEGDKPFDIYFSNYGTFSHCNDSNAVKIFAEIASHANTGSIIVADWLGWQSYEWQNFWTKDLEEDQVLHYSMSYLLSDVDGEADPFNLRLMNKSTIESLVERASDQSSKKLRILNIFDRSVLIGRHMETGEFNNYPCLLRSGVNSLLEPGERTNLSSLLFNYLPVDGFLDANRYFKHLTWCWNQLVKYVDDLMQGREVFPPGNHPVLQRAAGAMQQLISLTGEVNMEDARANIIEPQLAYQLRNLETSLQEGNGRSHGIVAVLEVI
ncbi:MAG: class I SAM-dependent methyltransferase [Clostridiales bacterium]|nr:class I SAM-dependent methyltransferase [Clostridiales bacterium]MCF8023242.1 class I SAM-dependent methyltransferase [Clostridiales bacterium]